MCPCLHFTTTTTANITTNNIIIIITTVDIDANTDFRAMHLRLRVVDAQHDMVPRAQLPRTHPLYYAGPSAQVSTWVGPLL